MARHAREVGNRRESGQKTGGMLRDKTFRREEKGSEVEVSLTRFGWSEARFHAEVTKEARTRGADETPSAQPVGN